MNVLNAPVSIFAKNVKIRLSMNTLSSKSRKWWNRTKIKKILDSSKNSSNNTSNLLMEDTLLQAMKSATEKEKDTTTTRKFGDLPLSLEENLNNTANMLKSIKTKDQRTFSSSMLLTMEFLMLNSMRSLLISEFKNWQNALEILQKNTENLSLKI